MTSQLEKDKEFSDFVSSIPSTTTTLIPEEAISHILATSGCIVESGNLKKAIAIISHKFISDIIIDCIEESKNLNPKNEFKPPVCLTTEVLIKALDDNGIDIDKPLYLVNTKP